MRKVMLCCGLGMSTSLLVKKTQKEAEARGLNDLEFFACAANEYSDKLKKDGEIEVCLVGPQIRYLLKDIQVDANGKNIKVAAINANDFSSVNGKKVLDQALGLLA